MIFFLLAFLKLSLGCWSNSSVTEYNYCALKLTCYQDIGVILLVHLLITGQIKFSLQSVHWGGKRKENMLADCDTWCDKNKLCILFCFFQCFRICHLLKQCIFFPLQLYNIVYFVWNMVLRLFFWIYLKSNIFFLIWDICNLVPHWIHYTSAAQKLEKKNKKTAGSHVWTQLVIMYEIFGLYILKSQHFWLFEISIGYIRHL